MQAFNKNTSLEGLEPLVKLFQETGDVWYFDNIVKQCKGYVQGRAVKASLQFGLVCEDCESTLMISLWKSVQSYNPELGPTFAQFVNTGFNKNLSWLFGKENRDNHFFGPCTKSEQYQETADKNNSYHMTYTIDTMDTDEWDLCDPRVDVENLICEQDAARSLMEDIKRVDQVAGDVLGLVATGREQREVAIIMGYIPEGTSQRTAQLNWISRKLKKCIPPTIKHYEQMGIQIPIKMRA